jgi:hypothetical protein
MSAFSLPGQTFSLVFVGYNSFWLLDTSEAQAACLRAVARHLAPGGRLAIDVFPPNADDREDEEAIVQPLAVPLHGRTVVRAKRYTYDPESGIATSDVRYYAGFPGTGDPPSVLARFRYRLRLAEPDEVQALLEREGYAVEATYGTYRRDPLTTDSPRAIFVATRPGEGHRAPTGSPSERAD